MNVFVTGHKGYIGVHLIELLKGTEHQVTSCDIGLFDGCAWEPCTKPDREFSKDIRELTPHDLAGHDCVIHLAALSNDPMGELDPQMTYSINRDGSIHLAKVAKAVGVGRFLFAGSCSIYGAGDKPDLQEDDRLEPLSAYAKSKIETEQEISKLADDNFTPTYLRNATAYGASPMLRLDLVANNLLASGLAYGEIRIMSDGTPWRPLIHCRDIARAFIGLLEAPRERIHNSAVNIGRHEENYRVSEIAKNVQQLVPHAKITYTGQVGHDNRNYRVCFDRFKDILPDFQWEYTLASGMAHLHQKLVEHRLMAADFESDRFVRIRKLKKRLHLLGNGTKELQSDEPA